MLFKITLLNLQKRESYRQDFIVSVVHDIDALSFCQYMQLYLYTSARGSSYLCVGFEHQCYTER